MTNEIRAKYAHGAVSQLRGLSMKFETLQFETTGHLSTITLNRPEKRNAISTR